MAQSPSSTAVAVTVLQQHGRLSRAEAADLLAHVEGVHFAVLEVRRRLGWDETAEATTWGCLRCLADGRHNLYADMDVLPISVLGGRQRTKVCQDCGSRRHTVTNAIHRVVRHSYEHSPAYRLVLDAISRAEARALRELGELEQQVQYLAARASDNPEPVTTGRGRLSVVS